MEKKDLGLYTWRGADPCKESRIELEKEEGAFTAIVRNARDHERIRSLTPTILFTSKKPEIDFSEESIEFVDLGGQKQYIKHHLSDPSRFRNLRTVIFVVDVQDLTKLEDVKQYFTKVLSKIQENNEDPTMVIFILIVILLVWLIGTIFRSTRYK